MVAGVAEDTNVVVIGNVTEVAPAAIVTEAGTLAAAFELLKAIVRPPPGAGAFTVTVFAVVVLPPMVAVGDSVRPVIATGLTVSTAVFVTVPYTPVMVTCVAAETPLVTMLNFAVVAPAGMVTLAGTEAATPELLSVTTPPPEGAGASMVT